MDHDFTEIVHDLKGLDVCKGADELGPFQGDTLGGISATELVQKVFMVLPGRLHGFFKIPVNVAFHHCIVTEHRAFGRKGGKLFDAVNVGF